MLIRTKTIVTQHEKLSTEEEQLQRLLHGDDYFSEDNSKEVEVPCLIDTDKNLVIYQDPENPERFQMEEYTFGMTFVGKIEDIIAEYCKNLNEVEIINVK